MKRALPMLLAAALLAAGCRAQPHKPAKDARAERPDVEFTHSIHVDQGIACSDCHEGIEKATSLTQRHLPKPAKCQECHNDNRSGPSAELIPPPRFHFSHAKHLPQVKGKCDTCHKKLPEPGEPRFVPSMETCTGCHKHQQDFVQGRCRPCHVDLKGYKPENAYAHEGDWMRLHGKQARPSAESCTQCHDQTYCASCHSPTTVPARPSIIWPEKVESNFIHRGDYVSRHMIEAEAQPASCRKCHGPKFCEACHAQQSLVGPETLRRPKSHNGQEWAVMKGSPNFHGEAARRDVTNCANCHDQGSAAICVGCHQVGGFASQGGASPHPKSFLNKHTAEDRRHNSMCAACHHGS
jgi:hypothetical protein